MESTPLLETTTFIDNLFALQDHSVILDSATASAGDETTMHNFMAFADVNFDGMSLDIDQDNIFSIGLTSAAEENMETTKATPERTMQLLSQIWRRLRQHPNQLLSHPVHRRHPLGPHQHQV
jgi:hypothetical protein